VLYTLIVTQFYGSTLTDNWGRMYRRGDIALQATCGGCDSLRLHQFRSLCMMKNLRASILGGVIFSLLLLFSFHMYESTTKMSETFVAHLSTTKLFPYEKH